MKLQGRNLSLNMRGADVTLLQQELRLLKYVIPQEEAHFGKDTRAAVLAVQQLVHIEATGIVDEKTATAINKLINQAPQRGTIIGVVSGAAGPIAGARVEAVGTNLAALTNAQGQYKLENAPAGNVPLQATAVGYRPEQAAVAVAAGQTAVRDFTLVKVEAQQSVVRGRVLKDDGAAIAAVKVVALQVVGADSQPVGEATAQADGGYEVKDNPSRTPPIHPPGK